MTDLGSLRAAWHAEQAEQRDLSFSAWGSRKAAAWRRDLQAYLNIGKGDFEALKAERWAVCGCGRDFKPGPNHYRQCFTCSNVQRADGTVVCAICGVRRHDGKWPTCAPCKPYEEAAQFLRPMVLVRDHFVCQMCGIDEGSMQLDHIDPEGSAWPWNVQTLCTACDLTKGKQYGALDELARLELILAYESYLSCFLTNEERTILRQQRNETLGSDMRAPKPRWRAVDYGETDEISGMLNLLDGFGRDGIEVSHA